MGCMIQDGDTGVLTGGRLTESQASVTNKVTRYNRTGVEEQLPSLKTARSKHTCASLDINGKKVGSWQAILFINCASP